MAALIVAGAVAGGIALGAAAAGIGRAIFRQLRNRNRRRNEPDPALVRCWRNIDWDSRNNLMEDISNYVPRMSSVSHVNIVLFGLVASGKSSFFNTIDSIFKGRVAVRAEAGSNEKSATKKFRIYSVNKPGMTGTATEELCAFRLCDTMGMEEDQGLDLTDVPYILEGKLLDQYEFCPGQHVSPRFDHHFVDNPHSSMKMHVVCYVVDALKVNMIPRRLGIKFRNLQELALARGIRIVILVTKIDQLCHLVAEDLEMTYKSGAVKQVVDKISSLFGTPQSLIYVIQNYHNEQDLNPLLDVLALKALRKLLDFADDCL